MGTHGCVLQFGQIPQQGFLFGVDLLRNFQDNVQLQVASAASARVGHSAAANANDFTRLRTWVDVVLSLAFKARDFDFCAKDGLGVGDRNFANKIRPVAVKQRMFPDENLDVQITPWSAERTCFALIRQSQGHAGINASRDFDVQLDGL